MSIDLKGKLYRDMPEQYRDAVSKKDFKKERRSQNRMAGEVFEGKDTIPDGAPIMDPDEDNIYSYDTSAFGAGSGRDTKRLSRADIKNLSNQGYSKADIVDYAENIGETGVITDGGKAQKLLERYKKNLAKKQPGDEEQPGDKDDLSDNEPINQTIINNPPPAQEPTPTQEPTPEPPQEPALGVSPETPDPQEFKDEEMQKIIDNNGNTNIQDVTSEQSNSQIQETKLDNDINLNLGGNNNDTEVIQENPVTNTGGDQTNSSAVTNPFEGTNEYGDPVGTNYRGGTPNFYGDYTGADGTFTPQKEYGDNPDKQPGKTQELLSSTIKRLQDTEQVQDPTRQDLTNPETFTNFQQVESQQDNVQKQITKMDNDINANIGGNNNLTTISQDNSVRNYGGDQRNFTYVSNSSNPYTDTPASMSTLAGFNSVSDSPGSNAAFVDQYQTLNSDSQKKYDNVGMAADMINRAKSVSPIDTNNLEDTIFQQAQNSRNRKTLAFTNVFGDLANFPSLDWQSSPAREPLPDFDPEEQYKAFT